MLSVFYHNKINKNKSNQINDCSDTNFLKSIWEAYGREIITENKIECILLIKTKF